MKPLEHIMSIKSKRVLSIVEVSRQMGYGYQVLLATPACFGVYHNLGFHENYQMDVYKTFE
jgi:hypothetical protein